eukprot:9769824-Karenia_brevis.AAC.1
MVILIIIIMSQRVMQMCHECHEHASAATAAAVLAKGAPLKCSSPQPQTPHLMAAHQWQTSLDSQQSFPPLATASA